MYTENLIIQLKNQLQEQARMFNELTAQRSQVSAQQIEMANRQEDMQKEIESMRRERDQLRQENNCRDRNVAEQAIENNLRQSNTGNEENLQDVY